MIMHKTVIYPKFSRFKKLKGHHLNKLQMDATIVDVLF